MTRQNRITSPFIDILRSGSVRYSQNKFWYNRLLWFSEQFSVRARTMYHLLSSYLIFSGLYIKRIKINLRSFMIKGQRCLLGSQLRLLECFSKFKEDYKNLPADATNLGKNASANLYRYFLVVWNHKIFLTTGTYMSHNSLSSVC